MLGFALFFFWVALEDSLFAELKIGGEIYRQGLVVFFSVSLFQSKPTGQH